nr:hypothetical protein [Tanacetum cinerariifolium]
MRHENPNTTTKTESDEIIKSGVEELVPILNEIEVTSEDESKCGVPISENSSICDDHSDIFSDSKNNDDISVYDDDFEDIEYVEASFSDPEIVNQEEENSDNSLLDNFSPEFKTFCDYTEETRSGNTTRADNSLPEYDYFCFEIEPDQERLINVLKTNISDDSNDPLLEEADLFLASDNSIPPGIENVADDSEKDVRFLEELLIDDFILSHESSDSYFEDNPSILLPPPEPPEEEIDFEIDFRDEISVERNIIVEFEFDARRVRIPSLTLDLPPVTEVFLCWIFVSVSKIFTSFDLKLVWGSPYPLISIA